MGDVGLFGPGTVIWRVNREGVLLLGGGAALILQVAHPLVAAGVAEHSNYRRDPWGRLYRTLDITTKVVFGDIKTAEEAARRIRAAHKRVHGVTAENGGRYPKGTPYDANDPELLMWVHATLVRTALDVFQRYVGPLTIAEQRIYYEEQKTLAEMFGVPPEDAGRVRGLQRVLQRHPRERLHRGDCRAARRGRRDAAAQPALHRPPARRRAQPLHRWSPPRAPARRARSSLGPHA